MNASGLLGVLETDRTSNGVKRKVTALFDTLRHSSSEESEGEDEALLLEMKRQQGSGGISSMGQELEDKEEEEAAIEEVNIHFGDSFEKKEEAQEGGKPEIIKDGLLVGEYSSSDEEEEGGHIDQDVKQQLGGGQATNVQTLRASDIRDKDWYACVRSVSVSV